MRKLTNSWKFSIIEEKLPPELFNLKSNYQVNVHSNLNQFAILYTNRKSLFRTDI